MSQMQNFQKRINKFLENLLSNKPVNKFRDKIIHDSVWGTNKFYSWEIALIDSPLLQRLRRIHQTGLAYLVYPTATHTRFEHSLGVTALTERLINHLNQNSPENKVSDAKRYLIRLTALLHDIGHSFFSHVSELVYDRYPEYQKLKSEFVNTFNVNPKGHEIFSFLMVKSPVFRNYFNNIIEAINASKETQILKQINFDKVAGFIIGYSLKPEEKYLADIINGPIDCDKLDYLTRDAKFAGPVIAYDIDRYLYTINVVNINGMKRLTVSLSGVNVIEQLIISKIMMYSYVYHHHKVRAIEAMIKRLCFDIRQEDNEHQDTKIVLKHPIDFLNYTDEIFLNSKIDKTHNSKRVKNFITSFVNRELWIRGQLISCFNTDIGKKIPKELLRLEYDLHEKENINELNQLKEKIILKIKEKNAELNISRRDIWIDVPVLPSANEARQIKLKKRFNVEETIELSSVFPLEQWVDAYEASKWKAHIFCRKEFQQYVYEASKEVFKEIHGFTINDFTKEFCKIG